MSSPVPLVNPEPFPDLPAGFWRGAATEAAAQAFLDGVEAWRAAMLTQLRQPSVGDHFSPSMALLLRRALGAADAPAPPLRRFPDLARPGTSAVTDAGAVLLWRARLVEFLADVWDVVGTPLYDLPECSAAECCLLPRIQQGRDGDDICRFCLEPLVRRDDGAGYMVHDHRCPALLALSCTD